jgi:hypothetical protein
MTKLPFSADTEFSQLEFLLGKESEESNRAMRQNVLTWKDCAHEEYRSRDPTLLGSAIRKPSGSRKTTSPSWTTIGPDSIEPISTKTGISKFYQEIPAEMMQSAFFTGIFVHFDQ